MGDVAVTQGMWPALRWAAYGVLALPLLSFLINGLWLGRKNRVAAAWLATAFISVKVVLALFLAWGYYGLVLGHADLFPSRTVVLWEQTWMTFTTGAGTVLFANLGFMLDPISVMMVVVISFISLLVNVYSIGYMREDAASGRFFSLLAFFSFAMLGLVVATNLAQTFFFWELVGAASYLLIGFWYVKPTAVAAAKKAFILTRLADAFFLMGLIVVGIQAGGFGFAHLNSPATAVTLNHLIGPPGFAFNLLTVVTLLIYMGAWGKSAMFPFHVWLPDAMEGPTPVSSLIHSATMVVAGIYLTARLFPLFAAAEHTLEVVAFTGAFTAVFAAVIACAQTDLKRILAFSTLSQLGLMMLSLGTSHGEGGGVFASVGYSASMFHVFTHAFFKCLLFLSAGVVIHAIHSNDIRQAGGLRKSLPKTYGATLVAVLAIAGFWPLSGFFSKEEILHSALANGHYVAFAAGLATSGLTAFYMSRYFFLVFHGKAHQHVSSDHGGGNHESILMTLPILILAVPSALAGWLSRDFFRMHMRPISASEVNTAFSAHGIHASNGLWLPIVAGLLACTGAGISWYWYGLRQKQAGFPGQSTPHWYRVISETFYVDAVYLFLAKQVGGRLVAAPAAWFEIKIVNGTLDGLVKVIRLLSRVQSGFHSGQVQWYIAIALVGLLLLSRLGGF
jgi:NADH-quinone oxidoreductase subunit L